MFADGRGESRRRVDVTRASHAEDLRLGRLAAHVLIGSRTRHDSVIYGAFEIFWAALPTAGR